MAITSDTKLNHPSESQLERFVRDYADVVGGVWDEIEPQVYDLMLPSTAGEGSHAEPEMMRITFDPEALPEHPGAQLASFGAPLIDRLLRDAARRGRYAEMYLTGLNLTPHGLPARITRAFTLAENMRIDVQRIRPLHFVQAVFWFEATFASDQKEQEIISEAVDLHYQRPFRHLDALLDPQRLSERPAVPLPEARRVSVRKAYPAARQEVVRTLASLANVRRRELTERVERQIARMRRYYADLRSEVDEQFKRSRERAEETVKLTARREALDREERLRVSELRQKSDLHVSLRLVNLLLVRQPKLLIQCELSASGRTPASAALELVWDPLLDVLEAATCPTCQHPTFGLTFDTYGRLICPLCKTLPRVAK